jgi:hypothetical protein
MAKQVGKRGAQRRYLRQCEIYENHSSLQHLKAEPRVHGNEQGAGGHR